MGTLENVDDRIKHIEMFFMYLSIIIYYCKSIDSSIRLNLSLYLFTWTYVTHIFMYVQIWI